MTFFTVPEAEQNYENNNRGPRFYKQTNVASCCCSRIDGDNYTTLESERKCGRSMLNLDSATRIGMVVCMKA